MLNIYYGRENLNKSKFIFDNLEGKALLIVPDQYTLEAERDAFFYLEKNALIDIDIMSFSRFGEIVVKRAGTKPNVLGREGRQMILTKIIRDKSKELEIFQGSAGKTDFVEMVNDFVSDLKQHNTSVEDLEEAITNVKDDTILKKKLQEIKIIYQSYEQYIQGKYIDSEDYISYYVSKIGETGVLDGTTVWIYGFDSFTDRNKMVVKEMEKWADRVNMVITYDESESEKELFAIGKSMIESLEKVIPATVVTPIEMTYGLSTNDDITAIEQSLYAISFDAKKPAGNVLLQKTTNLYNEAVNAAIYVLGLVRDHDYKYSDIAIISNDLENTGELYKRVFAEYGMDLFIDKKRNIMHHPAVNYILALLDVIGYNYRKEDVIRMAKTGFACSDEDRVEALEIYANIFNIRGAQWKKDFTKGVSRFEPEEIQEFNETRKEITGDLEEFNRTFTDGKTVREKAEALENFLIDVIDIEAKIESLEEKQEEEYRFEIAQENSQIWGAITNVLEQMVEGLGDEKISKKEFVEILKSGFELAEIGLLPPTVDGLIMGTMQRTRRNHIKATVVVNAIEGVLPAQQVDTGILNEDERTFLDHNNIRICKLSQLKTMEESMAIYKNISKTEEKLYMSYAVSDNEGKSMTPSAIFTKMTEIFPSLEIVRDRFEGGEFSYLIGGIDATRNNMINFLVEMIQTGKINPNWTKVFRYFQKNEDVDKLVDMLAKTFGEDNLSMITASQLYKNSVDDDFRLSPSRLEKFGRCPFAHFINYGLKLEENREYTIGAPEAGTIYHECLMLISNELNKAMTADQKVTSSDSPWMKITREESDNKVKKILSEISKDYMEGIMSQSKYEEYKAKRIERVCCDSVWMAIEHIKVGAIEEMQFEVGFGKGKKLPPIDINVENGKARIEGQIDRWDVLADNFSKVIDYKSGNDKYDEKEARAGVKLQLFIYLMATLNSKRPQNLQPAGAFYFHIDEAAVKDARDQEDIYKEMEKQYKLSGFLLDDERVKSALDGVSTGRSNKVYTNGKNVMGQEQFDKLLSDIETKVKDMANELTKGNIQISPKKNKNTTSCTHCPYKGICKFDITVEDCRFDMI